ncbi:Rv2231c family pyridoxal phosphate-dependent protein CobC [Dactylosporangium fulvum]|uniref:Aminotransferase n=1 Tax=Dactylosporangium fulvum TaxID=53359 RepID=A0ABY5W092_9ACTN|nr:Rv2231c family pyridoxal phosphate-dependent protein CobC [Dactylosporangium fulvum]UWP81461.1 Rv2231c family pyridoxal phosphate-dependent protein CobC [Dactylosporangium fulvum]
MLLRFHGDEEVAPGLVDLAVNVRQEAPPSWLSGPIAASLAHLARYPDPAEATAAVARRHRRPADEVLLTAGAAQAFTLLAQAFRPARALVVHPQFTEPESALLTAGHRVDRLVLTEDDGFRLAAVPPEADLVVIGNPTNPTSVLHPATAVAGLAREGRILVVDEAFADTVPGEPESLSERRDLPGLLVIRSLTKTWGLAGLRIGYVLGPADLIARLAEHAPLWSVSTPALAAAIACSSERAVVTEREIAVRLVGDRAHLVAALDKAGIPVAGHPASAFVLIRVPDGARVRSALRTRGFAVRRGETFPGLGPDWLRIAVRDTATSDAFVAVLSDVLGG